MLAERLRRLDRKAGDERRVVVRARVVTRRLGWRDHGPFRPDGVLHDGAQWVHEPGRLEIRGWIVLSLVVQLVEDVHVVVPLLGVGHDRLAADDALVVVVWLPRPG